MSFLESRPFSYALLLVLATLSTLAVLLRSYSRVFIVKNFGLDDRLIACACVLNMAGTVLIVMVLNAGGGKPVPEQTKDEFGTILRLVYAFHIVAQNAICCVQLSYLAFYARFIVEGRLRRTLPYIGVFVILESVAVICFHAFRCKPISTAWNPYVFPKGCLKYAKALITQSTLVGVGSFEQIDLTVLAASTMANINSGSIEYNLSIIIACIPGIKPLFRKVFKSTSRSSEGSRSVSVMLNALVHKQRRSPQLGSTSALAASDVAIRPADNDGRLGTGASYMDSTIVGTQGAQGSGQEPIETDSSVEHVS
ncbi:hypothetical protein BDZ91DRAFT_786776 [Kalaharituber pfeilii]|nr:hypothetical protein BDZ91DRAFT_786776 [Kalaharituber pfeilii]